MKFAIVHGLPLVTKFVLSIETQPEPLPSLDSVRSSGGVSTTCRLPDRSYPEAIFAQTDRRSRRLQSKAVRVLNDDEITQLQFAIDAHDQDTVAQLLDRLTGDELTELQFYLNSTAFMYACRRSTPEVAALFVERGVAPFELPYSDNNELKSAVLSNRYSLEMTKLVLNWLPQDMVEDMITSDWDPEDGEGAESCLSALELARAGKNKDVVELLRRALKEDRGA